MLYVTTQARQELKRMLDAQKGPADTCMRLVSRGKGKIGLSPGTVNPDDEVVEYRGEVLLAAGPGISSETRRISLDAYETPEGTRLIISEEVLDRYSSTVTVNCIDLSRRVRYAARPAAVH